MITIKNSVDIMWMKKSADILKEVFEILAENVKVGITTKQLDSLAHKHIEKRGAVPSFLNYGGFPASICTSINDVVVHGIPTDNCVLKDGDIIGIDAGVIFNGYHSDAARTFMVGKVSEDKQKLVKVTEECFFKAIEGLSPSSRVGDIGWKVQQHAESHGYGVVRALVGHGIGKDMHEDPSVPNYGTAGRGIRLANNMTICIEPMINMGTYEVEFLKDGWTVRTKDRKPSAHYENTVLITDNGVEILTL